MTKKSDAPAIRFKGFSDAWEQRKFSDITFPAGEKNKDNLPLESYSITNEHGFVPQDEKFENGGTMREADKRMYYIVSPNSFAYNPARINVGSIGYQNVGENVIVSSLYEVFKTSEDVDDRLLWHWFKSPDFQKLIMQLQEGGVRLYFYYDKLCMGEVSLPSLEEQRKIGKLFDTLDNLITLHQRKCALLFSSFQALISMMFTTSTFSWEQRKLGDVATFINGRAYSQPELLSSGKYKVLRVGNFYTNDSWYYSDLELGEKYYADYGDLLYTWSATFGPHIWLGDRVIYHYHIWKIDLSNQLEKQFAVQLLEQDKANILSSKNGSTMVHITKEGMEQKDVIIPPSTKEQQEIGAFFQQLDNLITLHQRELEKLQNIKKSMLEKMFV